MFDEYLKIYSNKSIYVSSGNEVEYIEGPQSVVAKHNQEKIKSILDGGWLDDIIRNRRT